MAAVCMELWYLRALRLNGQNADRANGLFEKLKPKLCALEGEAREYALLFFNEGWQREKIACVMEKPRGECAWLLDEALMKLERAEVGGAKEGCSIGGLE
ncbi:MAG: hypothetical protein RSB06_03010, partial [Clostridia bacterium]